MLWKYEMHHVPRGVCTKSAWKLNFAVLVSAPRGKNVYFGMMRGEVVEISIA